MDVFAMLASMGHERLVYCSDPEASYRAVIAVHSTRRGPAMGGTRLWTYPDEDAAAHDVLRLARAMTFKAALAGLPLGGGKAVILHPAGAFDRERLFRAHGRFVDSFGGGFITAEDVGVTPADLAWVRRETPHVKGLADEAGDPAPFTARGVRRAIQAAAHERWGSDDLAGRKVALQGCGAVGAHLARELHERGANLVVADVDAQRAQAVAQATGARVVEADAVHREAAEVFAPCALGGVLNDVTIAELQAELVAGAANNQLGEARHGELLQERGVLYAPDYAANAGGLISGCIDILGWSREQALAKTDAIYDTLRQVFARARSAGLPTSRAADETVAEILAAPGTEQPR